VMTYWCKPLFVDIEEELKKAEEKLEDDRKNEQSKVDNQKPTENKNVFAKLKNYNIQNKEQSVRPMKNRTNKNAVLPPQIQSKMKDINKPSEKQLLKENANRYTWEGRLTNFKRLQEQNKK